MVQIFLYVHIIWSTRDRQQILSKPVRVVLYAHLKKMAEEKGIHLHSINGVEDHMHLLLQLHPAQNLSQVMRLLRSETTDWLNGIQLLKVEFAWSDEIIAYSVSPGSLLQVTSFIDRQEEYHETKTFESEIEIFLKSDK
jgi:REP element-mobilizing transposase RayT